MAQNRPRWTYWGAQAVSFCTNRAHLQDPLTFLLAHIRHDHTREEVLLLIFAPTIRAPRIRDPHALSAPRDRGALPNWTRITKSSSVYLNQTQLRLKHWTNCPPTSAGLTTGPPCQFPLPPPPWLHRTTKKIRRNGKRGQHWWEEGNKQLNSTSCDLETKRNRAVPLEPHLLN